ncbi:MAG: hypothetical protein EPO21_02505 [Chloroflexota bacterium]|nr:MAG: hypothetical protein EPO21_02505 [Chloroflexota bacterium]
MVRAVAEEPILLFERKSEHIGLVTFNRPAALNALSAALAGELARTVATISGDDDLRVVVFTGAGNKAFCAGGDIKEFRSRTPARAFEISRQRQALFRAVETLPQVSIAAINGYAFGAGSEFALSCTLRVASDRAKLGLPELNLGIIPGAAGTQRLPRLVGKGRALDIILTGRTVSAEEALRIGLVDRVVANDRVLDEALELAALIARKAPLAARLARKAIDVSFDSSIEEGGAMESAFLSVCFSSEDLQEGIAAFEEQRPPNFRGK